MAKHGEARWKVVCKVTSSTLGKAAPKFIGKLKHLEKFKGPKFVVDRLKALQSCALQIRAGKLDEASRILSLNGIRTRKDKPFIPSGVEGVVVYNIGFSKKSVVVRRNLMITRLYTAYVSPRLTKVQFKKAKDNITKPLSVSIPDVDFSKMCIKFDHCNMDDLRLNSIVSLSGTSRYPHLLKTKWREDVAYSSMVRSLLTKGNVPQVLLDHFGDNSLRKVALVTTEGILGRQEPTYGKISFLQEGGYKARVVCQPNAWIQYYMEPLHRALMRSIVDIESHTQERFYGRSCVTDQNKGGWILKEKLGSNEEVFCFDLSAATDRFPIIYQTRILDRMGLSKYSQALNELNGPYNVDIGKKHETWHYQVGQPMGMYGSFPLFHLTHFCVLENLSISLKLDRKVVNFCVLGDDVVIFDKRLAEAYPKFIHALGMDITKDKSFTGTVGEFAGFLAIRTKSTSVFRPFKWGNGFTLEDKELNFLSSLGHKSVELGNHWKKSFEIVSKTLPFRDIDLTPLIAKRDELRSGNLPESRWFASVIAREITNLSLEENPLYLHVINRWQSIASSLGFPNDERSTKFDPSTYLKENRNRNLVNYSSLLRDPLIKECLSLSVDNQDRKSLLALRQQTKSPLTSEGVSNKPRKPSVVTQGFSR